MKINVIGLGYIGLPTAAMFAQNGVKVVGVDVVPEIVDTINHARIHIEEPGLEEVIKNVVSSGMLKASLKPTEADAFIISVPTPNMDDEYLSCDLKCVLEATKSIIPYLRKGNLVIIESTIAPRTTEDYVLPLLETSGLKVGKDIFLAHCPERVLPGQILYELAHNNRIIGGITKKCTEKAAELYSTFVNGELIKTDAKTAEMSKLMENTFRDVNIALANELTKICVSLDINVLDVIKMANKHPRVNIHMPGPGVGGHCLAVDPYFIYSKAPDKAKLIKLARDINCSMPDFVVDNVNKILKSDSSKVITALGVTYKPNVDDVRESPALKIIKKLENIGYCVKVCDPHVNGCLLFEQAIKDSDLILVLVAHDEFKNIDKLLCQKEARIPIIFDTTGLIKSKENKVINYGNLYQIK